MTARSLFAQDALLPEGWAKNVLLVWDETGYLTQVSVQANKPQGVEQAAGPVLPGMPNLHSHAFQRAFAGLSEYRGAQDDSFWTWRDLMYRFASRITPQQLEDIATYLYIEMLQAGYTSVCEFHYLHHATDGRPYADDAELSLCLVRAAAKAGIGLTLLPVLYQQGGFDGQASGEGQRRFIRSTDNMLKLLERLQGQSLAGLGQALPRGAPAFIVGLAPHSLRAVTPESLSEAVAGLHALNPFAPVHIHVAEQSREVEDCLAWSRQRPVQWLLNQAKIDARWCLIHATHVNLAEVQGVAASGAVVGLCPTTEANLGDGVFLAESFHHAGGRWGIGSDSHVCVNVAEELLLLEYGQRLTLGRRNVLAENTQAQVATAMVLKAVAGGAQASGLYPRQSVLEVVNHSGSAAVSGHAGIAVDHLANLVVLDAQHLALAGLEASTMLAAHIFASHRSSAIDAVYASGHKRVQKSLHAEAEQAGRNFIRARSALLSN